MTTTTPEFGRLLNVKEVAKLLNIHQRTVWRMGATGVIPAPIRLAEKTVRWRLSDIEEYVRKLRPELV